MGDMHNKTITDLARLVFRTVWQYDSTDTAMSFDSLQQHILDNEDNLPEIQSEISPRV